ncbi:hypothetical protein NEUTE2DRAFT_69971 [Neurospora tetrasperma FGSC 2509]|nr:hypothetical protein NEUTE2DRAFT_69971 [Neurospora tetrasperma FGSC 2509]
MSESVNKVFKKVLGLDLKTEDVMEKEKEKLNYFGHQTTPFYTFLNLPPCQQLRAIMISRG